MMYSRLSDSLSRIFFLKHILFRDFDTSSLGLATNKTQERVLMMAWRNENATMQFLSHEAGLEKGSLTTVIDSLETLGLVQRIRPKEDRRAFIIHVTPAGSMLAEKIESLFREHLSGLLGKLSEEDQIEFERAAFALARLIPFLAS